jgi:hypothetical protein
MQGEDRIILCVVRTAFPRLTEPLVAFIYHENKESTCIDASHNTMKV